MLYENIDFDRDESTLNNLYHSENKTLFESTCRKLLDKWPESEKVLELLGNYYQKNKNFVDSFKVYNEILRINPDSFWIYNNRGTLSRAMGFLTDAVEDYTTSIKINPENAEAYYNRGNALQEMGLLEESISDYKTAISINKEYTEAYGNLGTAYLDYGDLDKAKENYLHAVKLRPNYPIAHFNLSGIITFVKNDPVIDYLESIYPQALGIDRGYIAFSLGKAFDDIGEYDKSFKYFYEGNNLKRKGLDYSISMDKDYLTTIKTVFDSSTIIPSKQKSEYTPIFIVGMMRSGTSLVEQILSTHTKVYGAGELNSLEDIIIPLIDSNKNGLSDNDITTIRNNYTQVLNSFNVNEKVVVDKMTYNFQWIGFILAAFPNAKIINMVRDPIATGWSIYKHNFSGDDHEYAYNLKEIAEFNNLYEDMMAFWKEKFPGKIYNVGYENLTENQLEESKNILEFCDLEWQDKCLDFHKTKRAVRTSSIVQVTKKMYKGSSDKWKSYKKYLQPLISRIDKHNHN